MAIEYIKGDLFDTDITYILHGCNSKGVMGSGVAKIVRDSYPKAYEEYVLWCKKGFRLGSYLAVSSNNKIIINAVTQQDYGKTAIQYGDNPKKYVSYDAIYDIFTLLEKDMPNTTIAMPLIGASLGGGKWEIIAEIINSTCVTIKPVVYIKD